VAKILVVDDALTDRALAGGLLKRSFDCVIFEAPDGDAALAQIEQEPPDLVLTDLDMPGLNGLELVAAVKENHPLIPVILMTAKGSEEIAAQALQQGAASYVPKRRLAEDLVSTVQRVLRAARENRVHAQLMHYLNEGECRFVLHNDLDLCKSLVKFLLQMLRCLPLGDETERLRVGIALEEALSNAYYHGNLEVGDGNRNQREDVARRRLMEEPYATRKIEVRAQISREQATFVIRDDGPGFDPTAYLTGDEAISDQTGGRGLRLMHSAMDEVTFNKTGNEVTMVKRCVRDEEADEDAED
jgi:CheY-like chemotaxis protein/anti-sigma regulatory factor (Ser/Thr protein kinase)